MSWREKADFGQVTVNKTLAVTGNASLNAKLTYLDATFTIGDEAANSITTAIQITDGAGNDISWAVALPFYLSSDAAGQVPETGTDGAITAGTDGAVILNGAAASVQENSGIIITEADGDMDFVLGDTGADTYYINLIMPDGRLVTSDAITFAS